MSLIAPPQPFAPRVLAQAVCDPFLFSPGLWKVTVWGQPPHDKTRIYHLRASCERIAAQTCLEWFEAEAHRGFDPDE